MTRDLPAGVVTLLFTDVEGSTILLRELGDGYASTLHAHRRLLREAFAAHDGVEVDTQGQLPPAYGSVARPALEALESELPPDELAAAQAAASEATLADLVTQALTAAATVAPAARI